MKYFIYTFFLSLLLTQNLTAQDYYFEHYTVEDGLSHNTVLSSLQDSKGFLWFGTKDGLNRFDGYAFKRFQYKINDKKQLLGNYVESLLELDGHIYAGTDNGLFQYDYKRENFTLIDGTEDITIHDIESDASGNLWYIGNGTIYKYNPATAKTVNFPPSNHFTCTQLLQSPDGKIIASGLDELYLYEESSDSFKSLGFKMPNVLMSAFSINALLMLNSDVVLMGTYNFGVLSFNLKTKETAQFLPVENPFYIHDLALKDEKELWVASESGIHIYDMETKDYTNLNKNNNDPYALSDNAVYSLTVDNNGGIWAGTYFGGINHYNTSYRFFKKFFPKPAENSIVGNAVREIKADSNGNIWVGTEDNGLSKYNPKTDTFTNFKSVESGGTLAHHNIHALMPEGDRIWVSYFDNGIDLIDINTHRVLKHYQVGTLGKERNNFVFSLVKTKSGKIYAATVSGVKVLDPKKDQFVITDYFPENYHYTAFIEDAKGVLWAGTYWDGIYYYNPKTQEKGYYQEENSQNKTISHNHINGIYEDASQRLWVTTENGLNLYKSNTQEFKTYTTQDGFGSNVFYTVTEDDSGKLWATTSNGLTSFDADFKNLNTYTKAQGLLGNQFNYNSAYKDPKGRIYLGSVNGMVSFNPAEFIQDNLESPLYLTGLQINNKEISVNENDENPILPESITTLDKLELEPEDSSFSINFAALGYNAPQMTQYWYKLDGLNNDWVALGTTNTVHFTKLSPGDYTLHVKSQNSNGVWSKETTPLQIRILPPFYLSNIAFVLYTLFVILCIAATFRVYHLYLARKNNRRIKLANDKKEKEVYQAKIEFFTNISHEIRTPLTLIKSPLEKILKNKKAYPEIANHLSIMNKNTTRILNLVNQLLDFRKTETENMSLTFVQTDISQLVRKTKSRFTEAITDKNMELHLDIEDGIIAFVDAEALKKILSNLISNAIKYGDKHIYIQLEKAALQFKIIVRNDGYIIPETMSQKIFEPFYRLSEGENQSGTGIGLSLAHSLTEMHNGSLKLSTSDNTLNTFVVQLPIHQKKHFELYDQKTQEQEPVMLPKKPEKLTSESKPVIIVAEDNKDLRDFVAKELQENYKVYPAENGEIALNLLEEHSAHLVISDIAMPVLDGFTLCKEVKTNIETSHIPVILLTSKNALSAQIEGLESGADAYVSKPFSVAFLNKQVENLIENRKHIMQHYATSPLAHMRSIANTKTDEAFIKKLDNTIADNMADSNLNVETLAEIMNMSRSTLYRKIAEITNLSPNELINISRLKKAAELLKTENYKIYEVAEIVGYNSATSFGRNFQKQFQMTPTEYLNSDQIIN